MADTGNALSLYNAIQENGKQIYKPTAYFRDLSSYKIIYVMLKNATVNGVKQLCFYIAYQNPKGLSMEYFILPTRSDLNTLSQFQAGLVAINAANTFTLWYNLVSTSNQPSGFFTNIPSSQKSVLINNDYGVGQYLAKKNQTVVAVDIFNAQSRMNFYFDGDQNYAGNYYYFTNAGNALS